MWWRGAGWIPRRLDWLRSHHLVGLASFHFEKRERVDGKKKKRERKQRRHPGCQSAINWIAFQAKLWGWSMARKRLSARLRLLLGCVCVCAYENESWHERLFCLAAAQWCKPLETAPLFFFFLLLLLFGSSPSRRCLRTETWDKAGPSLLALLWTRFIAGLYAPSNQWPERGRINSPTYATHADDIVLYFSLMRRCFSVSVGDSVSFFFCSGTKAKDVFNGPSVYLSLVMWHLGSFQRQQ